MAFLTRNQIKEIVKKALKEVADFTGDIENYDFKHFHEFHKKVFITKLKSFVNEGPYYKRSGETTKDRYYDVPLSIGIFNTWNTITDCINFIYDNHTIKKRNPNKIKLS